MLDISKKLAGEQHLQTANAMEIVAEGYNALERYEDALPYAEKAVSVSRKAAGKDRAAIVENLCALAETYAGLGRRENARELATECYEICLQQYGEEHENTKTADEFRRKFA